MQVNVGWEVKEWKIDESFKIKRILIFEINSSLKFLKNYIQIFHPLPHTHSNPLIVKMNKRENSLAFPRKRDSKH